MNSPLELAPIFWPHPQVDGLGAYRKLEASRLCMPFMYIFKYFRHWLNLIEFLSSTGPAKVNNSRLWVAGADSPNRPYNTEYTVQMPSLPILDKEGQIMNSDSSVVFQGCCVSCDRDHDYGDCPILWPHNHFMHSRIIKIATSCYGLVQWGRPRGGERGGSTATLYAYDQHNSDTNQKPCTIYRVYSVRILASVCEVSPLILALWKLDRGHRSNVIGATIRRTQGLALCVFLIKRLRP